MLPDRSEDWLQYAKHRATSTRRAYLVSAVGHVMLADVANIELADCDLGGLYAIVLPNGTIEKYR